jgi:hypothetical protein
MNVSPNQYVLSEKREEPEQLVLINSQVSQTLEAYRAKKLKNKNRKRKNRQKKNFVTILKKWKSKMFIYLF